MECNHSMVKLAD